MKQARLKNSLADGCNAVKSLSGPKNKELAADLRLEKASELTESDELKLIETFNSQEPLTGEKVASQLYDLLLQGKISLDLANAWKTELIAGPPQAN